MGKNPKLEIMVTILPKFKTSYEGVSSLHLKKNKGLLKAHCTLLRCSSSTIHFPQ